MELINRPPSQRATVVEYMGNAGFVDIKAFAYKQPIGLWPRERLRQFGAMVLLMNSRTAFNAY